MRSFQDLDVLDLDEWQENLRDPSGTSCDGVQVEGPDIYNADARVFMENHH